MADIVSVAFTTLFLVALLTTTRRMITAAINRRIQRRLRIFLSVTVSSERHLPTVDMTGPDLFSLLATLVAPASFFLC